MVINLVAGFHALGTLMAIALMILPAAAARFWVKTLDYINCFCVVKYCRLFPRPAAILLF